MTDSVAVEALLTAALKEAETLRRWPVSTYRLQFHSGFTFRDATDIVPYLANLGVTHVYASPYLAATAGSTHGYDVIDHSRLNPELGTVDDYEAWLAVLRSHGLSHILDTVPNHMGVATNDNPWWNDILEHGPGSQYARYFDIDWQPESRPELKGKVLIPTLGKPYGQALEDGELKLSFDEAAGRFWISYFDRRFPVSHITYSLVLEHAGVGVRSLDANQAIDSEQPSSIATVLSELVRSEPQVLADIKRAVEIFNGKVGNSRSFDRLDALLQKQHYRLADWHVAFDEINYRRFFDVNDLAAIAMDREDVFDAAHAWILPRLASGEIAGLRIDHPDGLFDPAEYFLRLQRRFLLAIAEKLFLKSHPTAQWPAMRRVLAERLESFVGADRGPKTWPLFVSAEKILAMHEPLIESWAIQGTSGYDYLVHLNSLFVDPAAHQKFDALWQKIAADSTPYAELAYQNKRRMLESSLASELQALTHRLDELARGDRRSVDFTFRTLEIVIRETIACFGVYRTYITSAGITDVDRKHVRHATERAAERNPLTPRGAFEFLRDVILQTYFSEADEKTRQAQLAFAGKFQQLTSPVTAKGIEDTTFYQYNRLLSLNEVGGEPDVFGIAPVQLHEFFSDRQRAWPFALSSLSTHDTKRSEDVRSRLNVLSDLPDQWRNAVDQWFETNQSFRSKNDDGTVSPAADEEYLIYQTLVGAWPIDGRFDQVFIDRVQNYVLKAIREAKRRTRWGEPNAKHEQAVNMFLDGILDVGRAKAFHDTFLPFVRTVSHFGFVNSLSQTLVKLTSPGVPDTYQGTELWDLSLVDPDNRRPVDYRLRASMLEKIHSTPNDQLLANIVDGRLKMKLVATLLRMRREMAEFFEQADYTPLTFSGNHSQHAFGFVRCWRQQAIAVLIPMRVAQWVDAQAWPVGGVWSDTRSTNLPDKRWQNVLSQDTVNTDNLSELFGELPFVLLRAD